MQIDSQRVRVLKHYPRAVCARVSENPGGFAVYREPGGSVLSFERLASLAWRSAARYTESGETLEGREPVLNDVASLLDEGRDKIYSAEGKRMMGLETNSPPLACEGVK